MGNNTFTNEEISKIRACFDYKGINYSEIKIGEDKSLYIDGGAFSDLKRVGISKKDDKYTIAWNWSNKMFNQADISFGKVLKILKGYQ